MLAICVGAIEAAIVCCSWLPKHLQFLHFKKISHVLFASCLGCEKLSLLGRDARKGAIPREHRDGTEVQFLHRDNYVTVVHVQTGEEIRVGMLNGPGGIREPSPGLDVSLLIASCCSKVQEPMVLEGRAPQNPGLYMIWRWERSFEEFRPPDPDDFADLHAKPSADWSCFLAWMVVDSGQSSNPDELIEGTLFEAADQGHASDPETGGPITATDPLLQDGEPNESLVVDYVGDEPHGGPVSSGQLTVHVRLVSGFKCNVSAHAEDTVKSLSDRCMKAMGFLAHPPIFAQLVLGDTKLTDHQILGECGVDDGADVLLLLANLPPGLSELGFSEKHPKILRAYFDQHSVAHTDFMDEDQGVWDQLRMGSAKTLRHFFPCIFEVAPDHPGKLRVSRLRFGHSHQNLSQSRLACQPVFFRFANKWF